MNKQKIIIFNFAFIYMRLSFSFYEAVALGLKDKEPDLFKKQEALLNDMRKIIMEELAG